MGCTGSLSGRNRTMLLRIATGRTAFVGDTGVVVDIVDAAKVR